MNSLVQTSTDDGLLLQGYYAPNVKKTAILHIHGFEGNFYENSFVQVMAKTFEQKNISFLSANTRGAEKIKEITTINGTTKTIGARYELLEDSVKDIDAWVSFLSKQGHTDILLQGHSLGTMKAVRYFFEGTYKQTVKKLILIAPFDKKGLLSTYTTEPLEKLLTRAQHMIDVGKGDEMISKEFDSISVSYKTFVSWYKQDDVGRVFEFCNPSYTFPILQRITIPTQVIVGSKDEYFFQTDPEHPETALNLIAKHISQCQTILMKDAPHSFLGFEQELANYIVNFIGDDLA